MIKGITENEYSIIKNILKDYKGNFYAYGSRARGDFSELSDLDILIKSDMKILTELKDKFDKSYLPYVVNLTNYNDIDEHFFNLIKNDLTEL